jgi:hypothetical protein
MATFVEAFFGAEIFALGYSGIQSICYTLLMEFAFKNGKGLVARKGNAKVAHPQFARPRRHGSLLLGLQGGNDNG